MTIKYKGPLSGVSVPAVGGTTNVKRGGTVEVTEVVGKALLAQNPKSWSVVGKAKAKED